ncbi:ATP-binding protein [Streptomyces sp. ID05-39B]|uniref:ATP-binding protein n=1 Tax=Streptomyces sp. ID05-39B TaxID=3028664 RepID=UPI0029B1EEE8|nr:ATP-binding protein [Streptomyces sp. ID05-39B]MDX3529964.1 ATP-binding protein [Streptomyces sp. ID05-39B]
MSESDMEWRMEFTPHERCVGLVRRQVHRTLTRWGCGEDDVDTAVLVCSELATNAVRYAYVPHQNFEVRVGVTGKECLVEVSDVSDTPPRAVAPGVDAEHGRGLLLVAALAESVGHRERTPVGKTVWARLLLNGPVS